MRLEKYFGLFLYTIMYIYSWIFKMRQFQRPDLSKTFESFSFLYLRNCCFSALSFRPSLLAFENGIYIAEWWFISVKSWPLSRLPRSAAENLSQARPPYHRRQWCVLRSATAQLAMCFWDGDISWTMTSRGHYFSRWVTSCGHSQRVTFRGHFWWHLMDNFG